MKFEKNARTYRGKVRPLNPEMKKSLKSEQSCVELRPSQSQIQAPDKMPVKFHATQHHDMAAGGLNTENEIKSWEEQIDQSNFHRSVLKKISQGVQK